MITPLLPLESFRRIIGYHPFHFWQLSNSDIAPASACNDIVKQYAWQNADSVGREDILQAIATAEARLLEQLGYSMAPHFVEETLPYPQFMAKGLARVSSIGSDGRWLSVRASEGEIRAVGVETLTAIQTGVSLTLSDADGDGLDDTFTLTTASITSETEADNIAVYFGGADRLDGEDAGDRWRIQPVKVTINANGTVTVRGRAWLLVKPILYEGVAATDIDPTTASNFAATLDVYRRYTNPDGTNYTNAQATLMWETAPWPSWAACCVSSSSLFGNSSTDPAAVAYVIARSGIRDAETGELAPGAAVYDSTNQVWQAVSWGICRPPDRVAVRYLAGAALINGEMQSKWQTVVARLAAAELSGRPCACDGANRELYRWQFDLARAAGANDEQYRISEADLDNPLGTKAGQVYAWKQIKQLANLVGMLA